MDEADSLEAVKKKVKEFRFKRMSFEQQANEWVRLKVWREMFPKEKTDETLQDIALLESLMHPALLKATKEAWETNKENLIVMVGNSLEQDYTNQMQLDMKEVIEEFFEKPPPKLQSPEPDPTQDMGHHEEPPHAERILLTEAKAPEGHGLKKTPNEISKGKIER